MGSVEIEQVYRQIVEFAEKYGARKVVLFGSRARGTNGARSDIDLAVYDCVEFEKLYDSLQEELWSLLTLDTLISFSCSLNNCGRR